jgi:tetratricopeptide (TPR) repeat protein
MIESLLDKAWPLRKGGEFRASYEILLEAANLASDPMEKASALIAGVTDLLSLQEIEWAKKQLSIVKSILADPRSRSTSDEDERTRLNLGAELQEALIAVAEGRQKEALAAFDFLLKTYKTKLEVSYFRDIRETVLAERAFLFADLGAFDEALPVLEKLEPSQFNNSSVILYWATATGHPKPIFPRESGSKPPLS